MSATAPKLGNTGREMRDNTGPVPEVDYAWTNYLGALSHLLDPIADVTRPPDDSGRWTVLASPLRCPNAWLPVLAQWAGVRRPDTMTLDELREIIGPTSPGMWRGTRAGLLAAARRFLAEDALLYYEEFADGDAYHFRVFTYNTEPEVEAQIREALDHAKPAGLFPFTYEVRVGQTWAMLRDCGPTWWQVNEYFADWREVMYQLPPPPCPDYPEMPEPPEPPEPVEVTVTPESLPAPQPETVVVVTLNGDVLADWAAVEEASGWMVEHAARFDRPPGFEVRLMEALEPGHETEWEMGGTVAETPAVGATTIRVIRFDHTTDPVTETELAAIPFAWTEPEPQWELTIVSPNWASVPPTTPLNLAFWGVLVETTGIEMELFFPPDGTSREIYDLVVDSETQWRGTITRGGLTVGRHQVWLLHDGARVAGPLPFDVQGPGREEDVTPHKESRR